MAIQDIIAATVVDAAFSETDKQVILGVIEEGYAKSATARAMFDSWVASGRQIEFVYGDGRFDAWDGIVTLDLKELDKASYIDFNGKAVQDFPFTAIIHELGHALELLPDNWDPLNPAGDNQNFANIIYKEAGYELQLAYMGYDASGSILVRNREYTDGEAIENAWVKKWAWLPNDFDVDEGGLYTVARKDLIIGSADDNVLKSQAGDDFVYGLAGKDTLYGGTGDDRLNGGEGADVLYGEEGVDEASYQFATAGVTASLAAPSQNTGDAAGDVFVSVEGLIGSDFADTLTGDAGINRIEGRDGNDKLDGGVGADRLIGGRGNDSYQIDNAGDVVVEAGGEGTDRVVSTVSYALTADVENLQLIFGADTSGTGNTLANYIGGNGGANILDGRGGADTLFGGAGGDTFVFRAGEAAGDTVGDFTAIDKLLFIGFGAGATLTEVGSGDSYTVASADASIRETITLKNVFGFDTSLATFGDGLLAA